MSRNLRQDKKTKWVFETGENAELLRNLATLSIKRFFSDKKYFCGGPVPECLLYSENSILLVMRTQNNDSNFEFIHRNCLDKLPENKQFSSDPIPWSIRFLITLMSDLKKKSIPYPYHAGMLLLYFKFCKGQRVLCPYEMRPDE